MPAMKVKSAHGKAKKGTLGRLLKMLFKDFKWQMIVCMICIILTSISNFTSSIFVKNITEVITRGVRDVSYNPINDLTILLIIMGSIYLVGLIGSFTYNYIMGITTQKFLNKLRKEMFDHMETLPIKYFDTNAHGDIMSMYTNDTDTIRQLVSQSLPSLFQTAFTVLALLVIMLNYSLWLTIIVLLGAAFMLLDIKLVGGKSAKFFVKQQDALGKVEGSINYNKERYALIKGDKGEIYVPMFNRVVEYTIHLENEVMQKTYPIEGDDMTLEIQALINHNQSTHTLQDSKKLQETIERIREEAK